MPAQAIADTPQLLPVDCSSEDEKGKHVPSGPRLFRVAQLAIAQWKRAHSGDSGADQAGTMSDIASSVLRGRTTVSGAPLRPGIDTPAPT
ncbi:hypothetical protein HaLaN_10507 [Haematococcus lacustris]|uniref:Uncharacterized protein n=1 Tax=Haematococcus lacustris TaxID=44745 RepID=A0A699Z518_HAELA|nr:hypothetical protein HaLaN_10507 [Haematococcus lacustris]